MSDLEAAEQKKPPAPPTKSAVPSPTLPSRDPSLPASIPTTSKAKNLDKVYTDEQKKDPLFKRCYTFFYNKENGTFCGRTCKSWLYIIVYSIVYVCFLCTYMCMCLYCALWCIRLTTDFDQTIEKLDFLTYSEHDIGLSLTPITESNQPLIWYREDDTEGYQRYVKALDNLLENKKRKGYIKALGPCGIRPYGYGSNPCVIVRINKRWSWAGKPLELNSTEAKTVPVQVQNWMKKDKKLWLHCSGYHSYEKEHVGKIRYFPDPPGFDPTLFPLHKDTESPLVALQISDFSLGISLVVKCNLWYANGPSSAEFVLYVTSDDKIALNRSNV